MAIWRQVTRGLRALTDRTAADRDIADEVDDYVAHATAAHMSRGLTRDQALRAARIELGGTTAVAERIRGHGWENAVDRIQSDLRFAARRLRATPAFTAMAVLTLALGIGATTAIFSAVNRVLFEALPYRDADRIAIISEIRSDGGRNDGTFGMYREFLRRERSFEAIALLRGWQPTMTGPGEPERVDGQRVTASYFTVLGVSPAMGRAFQDAEDRLGGPSVIVISDAFWKRRFNKDPAIVGRTAMLDEVSYTIIGVMSADFENVLAPSADVWRLLQYDMSLPSAWGHHLRTIGRLGPGVTLAVATQEVNAIGRAVLDEVNPESYADDAAFAVTSLRDDLGAAVKPALIAVLAAVVLVLVIACVNVTNLLLARGVQRRGEFALRAALGAGRSRLISQLLTENILLATIGGVVGMAVAAAGVRILVALSPPEVPRLATIGVDGPAFMFGLVVTTVIGIAVGLMPAFQAAAGDSNRSLQLASRRSTGGHRRTRGALVVAEVALALVLLVSSGLLLRSLQRVFAIDVGFDASRLLTMQVRATSNRFSNDTATLDYFDQVLAAVRQVPGVTSAALTSQLPLSGDRDEYGVRFEPATDRNSALRYGVTPGYIETMGIPLRAGRSLQPYDRLGGPRTALISETFARRAFAGRNPIGQRFDIGPAGPYTIVGIVGDVNQASLGVDQSDAVYTAASQWQFPDRVMSLVIRATGDEAAIAPAVRQAVWSIDKDQAVVRVATMDDLLDAATAERRFALVLFAAFALAAMVLAGAGIYGVLSGAVIERTREIGVRTALGASRSSVVSMILGQGMGLVALGIVIGVVAAMGATRGLSALLFDTSPLDPATYIGVAILLGAVAAAACALPAWRAARLDPATTLRSE